MPLVSFLGLILAVVVAAFLTLFLALQFSLPLAALGFTALVGSAALGFRQWG